MTWAWKCSQIKDLYLVMQSNCNSSDYSTGKHKHKLSVSGATLQREYQLSIQIIVKQDHIEWRSDKRGFER